MGHTTTFRSNRQNKIAFSMENLAKVFKLIRIRFQSVLTKCWNFPVTTPLPVLRCYNQHKQTSSSLYKKVSYKAQTEDTYTSIEKGDRISMECSFLLVFAKNVHSLLEY